MTKLTTAFLGVAHIHTPDFVRRLNARSGQITVKYVYDREAERGTKVAGETGAQFVSDVDTILNDPEVTSVIVCSETNFHEDLVIRAAKAGKNLFVEKPLGLGAEDSANIAAAIKEAGVIFQTGFFQRSSPINIFIKKEIEAGNLGKITRVSYSNCHQAALDGWFDTDWRWLADKSLAGGGAMLDLGAHMLDLIIDTIIPSEGEVTSLAAALGNKGGRYGDEIDEYGTALLTFASGATATFDASWIDPKLKSTWEIYGTEGQIQVIGYTQVLYFSKKVEGADGSPITELPASAPHAFELWVEALLGNTLPVPLVTVDQAALGSTLMERIYISAGRTTR
ncbi:MAG: Gfo/Idh/MocA family oxidoreductase [Capsulimonas sp.]|uniref:Gfo/Idh/MocA family protein n=1 Tax=Capsulimonas sp. TaxID=2494211 RepID=UPI003265D55F